MDTFVTERLADRVQHITGIKSTGMVFVGDC